MMTRSDLCAHLFYNEAHEGFGSHDDGGAGQRRDIKIVGGESFLENV